MSGKSLASQEANRMLDKIRVGVTKARIRKFATRTIMLPQKRCVTPFWVWDKTTRPFWPCSVSTTRTMRNRSARWKANAAIGNTALYITIWRSSSNNAIKWAHCAKGTYACVHHGLRVVPAHRKKALHQYNMVIYDAFETDGLSVHQQRLVTARPVLRIQHQSRTHQTRLPYQRGNSLADKRKVQKAELLAYPWFVHLLHVHRIDIHRYV